MNCGWMERRARRRERRSTASLARRVCAFRSGLESLEERRLLTGATELSPQLVVQSDHSDTSLIVQFRDGATGTSSLAAYMVGGDLGEEWTIAPGLREVSLDAGTDLDWALAAYAADPNVTYAEPDFRVHLSMIPDDPLFEEQWDMLNTGQMGGPEGFDIRATSAWDVTLGSSNVVVAVLDSGVDYTHPDLAPNMWQNAGEIPDNGEDDDFNGFVDDVYGYDFVNNDGDPMDDYFHGTHVAGTIAAQSNNGIGIAGVAPNVRIMAIKFLDDEGNGLMSNAIAALNYAVANGADISNNSWGGPEVSQAFKTALANAASHNHLFVAAAGNFASNNDSTPFYPASYDSNIIVSVAATDRGDHLAYFSNYGKTSVDLGAPGVEIFSTLPTFTTPGMLNHGLFPNYGQISGTSMAAPHVSGVLALLKTAHPEWGPQQLIQKVLSTVDPHFSLPATTVSGGRLNAAAALGIVAADHTPPRIVQGTPTGEVTGPIDYVRLEFSEDINPDSFRAADASFQGPNGPLLVLNVVPVTGNPRKFDVLFAPQTAAGDYSLVVGPHIADPAGNEIDQNGNGVAGVEGEDEYTVSFSIPSPPPEDPPPGDPPPDEPPPDDPPPNDPPPDDPPPEDPPPVDPPPNDPPPEDPPPTDPPPSDPPGDPPPSDPPNDPPRDDGGVGGTQNAPPVPSADVLYAIQDNVLTISLSVLLANDADPNGDFLNIESISHATGGIATLNANGTITFTPTPGSLATGGFQYAVSDGQITVPAYVTIYVGPRNPWHHGYDVNHDGFVAADDALLIVNFLNAFGSMEVPPARGNEPVDVYYDVIADNHVAADDALAVINYINAEGSISSQSGGPEGEPASAASTSLNAAAVDQCLADYSLESVLGTTGTSRRKAI